MKTLSKYRTSTLLPLITFSLLILTSLLLILSINFYLKRGALQDAEDKASLMLDRNLAVHDFYSNDLKPALFEMLKDTISKGYFDPNWMSSTHAISHLHTNFKQRNEYGYYYKDAAINARDTKNEADSLELNFFREIKENPRYVKESGIITIENEPYYYVLAKGETLEARCIICHDTPDKAPSGLVAIYGHEKSFNRNVGEIISVVSIRVPLSEAYQRASSYIRSLSAIVLLMIVFIFLSFLFVQKKLIYSPLRKIQEAILISKKKELHENPISINTTQELSSLVDSYNQVSHKLFEVNRKQEETIQERTIELERKVIEIEDLNKTKDKFLSIISHDLRSPFNSIIGFSNLLVDQIRKEDHTGIDKYAEIINLSSKKAMDLLTNLMEWSQSQTGRMEFHPEYFELIELIHDTELLLSGAIKQKSIRISKNIPDNMPVFGDKKMISTVLRNLISNAIKFTYPEGRIRISVEEKQKELLVSVSDSGVGISKANSQKLFKIDQPFSTTGTKNENGTGLGLILCKEFVEKHDGKIWVESEEGKGSSFYFTIPMRSLN